MRRLNGQRAGSPMLESLEGRRLLSGNVTVTATAAGGTEGLITVNGDNKSNQVEIHTTGSGYLVTGLNGTKVNGAASAFVDATYHFRSLAASMGNGEDDLQLNALGFNNASVDMGNGEDTVEVTGALFHNNSATAHGDLNISTGNGSDAVTITDSYIEGNADVNLGNGPDSLKLVGSFVVVGNAHADAGHGPDVLDVSGVTFISISGTVGADAFEKLII